MQHALASHLFRAVAAQDADAYPPLLDLLQDEDYRMLPVGETYFIRTPTFYFLGTVVEATNFHVRLGPGAYQVNHLRDPDDLLRRGKFGSQDRYFVCDRGTIVPFMWLGPTDPWPFDLAAAATPAEAAPEDDAEEAGS